MLDWFQRFDADGLSLDQLVALRGFGKMLRTEFETLNIEEPEYVDIQLKSLSREIFRRNADALEARKREIEARLDSLKTPGEKKSELLKEKEKIDKQLKSVGA